MVNTVSHARPARPHRVGEIAGTTRWQPRWTRLLESERPAEPADDQPAAWEEPSPSDARRVWDRQKALTGAVGSALIVVLAALMLWQATGVVLRTALGSREEQRAAPAATRAPVATHAAAAPAVAATATRAVVTITIVPTAVPPAATPQTAAAHVARAQPTVAPTRPTTPVPQPTAAPSSSRAAAAERVHTVARGDTLFSIARRNGTTVSALVAANGLPSADAVLSVGRRLVLP